MGIYINIITFYKLLYTTFRLDIAIRLNKLFVCPYIYHVYKIY